VNFNPDVSPYNMPELKLALRYALLVMAAIAFGMLAYFWAKGWIGGRWRRRGGAGGEHGD
jgi:magnesium transporter